MPFLLCQLNSKNLGMMYASYYLAITNTVVKDTIGAGDAHIGAFISYRKMGYSVANAALLANTVSGAVVAATGATLTDEQFAALNIPINKSRD